MDKTQSEEKNRRPLAVRDLNFTKRIAVWLSQKQITPNQISLMSIAFALLGCAILAVYHYYPARFGSFWRPYRFKRVYCVTCLMAWLP